MPFTASDICKILLAIILPPVGVFLERGCGTDLLINILLTILGKALISSSECSEVPIVHHPCFRLWIKYADTLTGGGEGVIQSEGCISMT
ncbi:Plasma membrane proteolipid 3 [Fusarium oxysporum f. sp. raphani]|uniref:Plasma membrane proteolipid 3 n=1 Tax=Fusarium oxysporum f. sp. raphani TaxID=96318 RepID=A0A8J5PWT1_FUSOX|nr:Plasma membrane proteolipid 3 [Fusarium oxysporum f. sp. raphani]